MAGTILRTLRVRDLTALEDAWYRTRDVWVGDRQLIVQDSDGDLLRFFQDLRESAEARERRDG